MNTNRLFELIQSLYYQRDPHSIKNDYGKALIVGGSRQYPLAVVIASHFASCSGCGYVGISTSESAFEIVAGRVKETCVFPDTMSEGDIIYGGRNDAYLKYDSLLFGNGMADDERNSLCLENLLKDYQGNLVIDATGIRIFSHMKEIPSSKATIIMTPHLGEASELLKMEKKSRDIHDYIPVAIEFCKKNHIYLLLKSFSSALVTPSGEVFFSEYDSTPALAHAGSGDGLAGYLVGLLAYATKKESTEEIIQFADAMIHLSAKKAEENYSAGLADILYSLEELKKIIAVKE